MWLPLTLPFVSLHPPPHLAHKPPLHLYLPSLMIPDGDGQSLPSSKRDALKHHCGREGSIRFFFFKMIMKTCGLNVSLYAVLLGGLSLLAWTSSAAWKGWRVLVILLSLHFVLP